MEQVFLEDNIHGKPDFPYAVYKIIIPDYITSFPLHWHKEIELIYVSKGCGEITVEEQKYTVNDGDIIIILPQIIHSINGVANGKMEYYNILFDFSILTTSPTDICYDKYYKPLITHDKLPPVFIKNDSELHNKLKAHIEYLTENRKQIDGNELYIKIHLLSIIKYLYDNAQKVNNKPLATHNNYSKLKDVLNLIQTKYNEEITVADAADLCMYSQSYFMKIFKEMTGKTFTAYLIEYRLNIATRLLKRKELSISAVAEMSGFNNFSYFTRIFKLKYSYSPSEYRKVYSMVSE